VTKSVPEQTSKIVRSVKNATRAHRESKKLSSIQAADYTTGEESFSSCGKPPKTPNPPAAVQVLYRPDISSSIRAKRKKN
jgi:hypothetical protein